LIGGVASYNPWVSLAWMITGKTVGGMQLYPRANCLDRETALRMWTENTTWFSNEVGKKGRIEVGQLADLIVPDKDFYACAESEISDMSSHLTIVGGKIVYAAGQFASHDKAPPPAMPDWSPVRRFGGYAGWGEQIGNNRAALKELEARKQRQAQLKQQQAACGCAHSCSVHGHQHATAWTSKLPIADLKSFWGALGCACWAV
jgi:hypothetical protein